MGLRIRLKPHERLIINGCVVENGDRRNTLTVSSFAQVLKSKDILLERDATTLLRRIYFAVQLILIDERVKSIYLGWISSAAAKLYQSFPSHAQRAQLSGALDRLRQSDYYKTLKALRELMNEEDAAGGFDVKDPPPFPKQPGIGL